MSILTEVDDALLLAGMLCAADGWAKRTSRKRNLPLGLIETMARDALCGYPVPDGPDEEEDDELG